MFKKKKPKCFQKLPQKVAKAVLPGIDVFHLSPKKLLFEDTLSPKTLKKIAKSGHTVRYFTLFT